MSIKIEEVSQPQEFVYPLAFRSKHHGYTAIFTSLCTGMVVETTGIRRVGEFAESFVPHTSEASWEPVTITISHP